MTRVTSIDLNPPTLQVLTTETFPFTVEWQDLVGIGNNVSIPFANIYDNSNGIETIGGFQNNFGANSTQSQYIIDGTKLQAGHTYTAILTVTSNTQIYKARLIIGVPQ
jgi:hypothetical protein